MKLIIVIIIIVLILIIFYYNNNTSCFTNKFEAVPKIIWSYWHDLSNMPTIVSKCINTWKINNTNYTINVLDDKLFDDLTGININKIFRITNNKSYQKKSDFIRLYIIYLYGGIWMDASMICMKPEPFNFNSIDYEFFGYLAPNSEVDQLIDSWFLAAIPRSTFVKDWLTEFSISLSYTNETSYCTSMYNKMYVPKRLKNLLPYLTIHLCAWAVVNRNPTKYRLYLENSTDVGGPLYYIAKHNWSVYHMLSDISNNGIVDMKIFKLTGPMRHSLSSMKVNIQSGNPYLDYVIKNN